MSIKTSKIEKYGFYAYIKGLEKGLGLVVLGIDTDVSGVKLHIGKIERFSMKKTEFERLLNYDIIEFVDIVPKFVWKEYKKTYDK